MSGVAKNGRHFANAPLFKGIDSAQIEAILASASTSHRPAGSWFFHQGEPATNFYLLTKGHVAMHLLTNDGRDVLLRVMSPFEVFGYRAIDPAGVQAVSVEAVQDCKCLSWSGPTMRRLFLQYPRLAVNALEMAIGYLHEFASRYTEVITESLERRVARTLLDLAERMGRRQPEHLVIDIEILEKDIGRMVGGSVFTVSRIFASWTRRGILQRARGRIVLRDVPALRRIATIDFTAN